MEYERAVRACLRDGLQIQDVGQSLLDARQVVQGMALPMRERADGPLRDVFFRNQKMDEVGPEETRAARDQDFFIFPVHRKTSYAPGLRRLPPSNSAEYRGGAAAGLCHPRLGGHMDDFARLAALGRARRCPASPSPPPGARRGCSPP